MALVLSVILLYEEIVVERGNPLVLLILTGLLVVVILEYYLSRRRNLVAHFILESSEHVALYAVDLDDCYMAFNKSDIELVEKFYDFTPVIGGSVYANLTNDQAIRLKNNIERAKKGETFTFTDEVKLDGKTYYWENMFAPFYSQRKKLIGVFCFTMDITEQKLREIENERLIYQDMLTGVYNRRFIELAFNECVLNKVDPITIIMSDLNKFMEANDTYGHACGDQILKDFGKILTKVMPEEAVVARLGGDEFAVLLPGVSEKQAEFLMNLVKSEMIAEDMPVTVSLGSYTDSYEAHKTFVDFCICADERMYRDKNQKG
ncbi:sensor domain-containing diguanylate cyclase [Streptococcus equinus]|nr:sensor domain-containing diguanylate cyclase [Streptococcus equinus]